MVSSWSENHEKPLFPGVAHGGKRARVRFGIGYKLIVFHLHLTDDQGWRGEIKKYPLLTEVGSRFDPKYKEPDGFSGHYTQEQLQDLVVYAQWRGHCLGCRPI